MLNLIAVFKSNGLVVRNPANNDYLAVTYKDGFEHSTALNNEVEQKVNSGATMKEVRLLLADLIEMFNKTY